MTIHSNCWSGFRPIHFFLRSFAVATVWCAAALGAAPGIVHARIEYAIKFAQDQIEEIARVHPENPTPFIAKLDDRLIVALRSANEHSLTSPAIAAAGFIQGDDAVRLVVYWIEVSPSIDAVEIAVGGKAPTRIPLDEYIVKSNREDAQQTVRYCFIAMFKPETEAYKQLQSYWGKKDVRCSLVKKSRIVSTTETLIWDKRP